MLSKITIPAFFFLFALFPFQHNQAQDEVSDIIVDARLWTSPGDTIVCKIIYINQYSMQFKITEVDTSGIPQAYYSPKDLLGFSYQIKDNTIEFTSMTNPSDMGRIFLRVAYRGRLTLYQYLEINHSSTVLSFLVSYYLWDGAWLDPPITKNFELESLLYHFSDCPELEYKIKTGTYGLSQIADIMREYEACILTDDYEYFYE